MRVVVSGFRGLIGGAVTARLRAAGHEVIGLSRTGGSDAIAWDPERGVLDAAALTGVGAAIHLAGEGIGEHRWSPAHKARIRSSRLQGTALLASTLAQLSPPPAVLLSASAVGYYGERGATTLTEDDGPGDGFLADICVGWEGATAAAADAGIRVVTLRAGVVLSRHGGALGRQLTLFRAGIGGRLGSGRQYLSWITLDDATRAIEFALATEEIRGPLNMTAPEPVTNAAFTHALARALHRPAVLPVPAPALRIALGREMADELVLTSTRAVPARLLDAGFGFEHPEIGPALAGIVGP